MRFNFKERLGVLEAGIIFTKQIQWVYRDQPLVDVGIDALIEESINGNPTGKFLAAQIKSGKGNFYDKESSYVHYVSNVHQNYWLNLDLPIIIVAHIPEDDITYWEFINDQTLVKTDSNWKIEIPKSKILNKKSITELQQIIKSNIQSDFLTQFLNGDVSEVEIEKISNSIGKINSLTETLNQITDIMTDLSSGIVKDTRKINHYISKGLNHTSREIKNVMNNSSTLLNNNSRKLTDVILNFSSEFAEAFSGYEKLAIIYFHLTKDYQSLTEAYDAMNGLTKTIKNSTDSLIEMRNQVSTLPTEYANLANARMRMINASNTIIEEFKISNRMANKFTQWLYERIY